MTLLSDDINANIKRIGAGEKDDDSDVTAPVCDIFFVLSLRDRWRLQKSL